MIKIIKCHHENCDGSGYPHGLIKPEIPLEARIIRIIDTYVALTSQRHYREKFSRVEAIEKVYHAAQIGKFDHILTTKFINFIRLYPKGAKVELNDRSQAIVNKDLANGTVELADSHTVEKSIVDKVNIAKCLWFI
ncbi:HD-GYP domain-containing protein [Pseudoalteromonas lipolytica]|uniref:HD-GYP domain-containing protein n=1 Tax=Pseudoalteromonas lipolytica TaxID=570156 RepID=UPI003A96D83B